MNLIFIIGFVIAIIILWKQVLVLQKAQKIIINDIKILSNNLKKDDITVSVENKQQPEYLNQQRQGNDNYLNNKREKEEYYIGAKIATFIGIIAVLFGVGFFLKYTFDNDLIGETNRIIIGFLLGAVFIMVGERLRKKFENYAMYIIGGGFSFLYLSTFSGYSFYHLFNHIVAFLMMVAITVVVTITAYKLNSKILATIATLGGLLSPILVSTGQANETVLFSYIIILSGMIVYLSWKKNWIYLILLSAIGSFILYSLSFFEYYTIATSGIYLTGISLIWFIYMLTPFLYVLFGEIKSSQSNHLSYFISFIVTVYSGLIVYEIFNNVGLNKYNFVIALIPAIIFSLLAKKALINLKQGGEMETICYLLAMTSFAVAMIPALYFDFNSKWVTFAWITEAIILSFLAFKTNLKSFSVISYIVFIPGLFRLLFTDSYITKVWSQELNTYIVNETFIFNERFLIYIIGIASTFILAYFALKVGRKKAAKIFGVLGNLLALILIWLEIDLLKYNFNFSEDFASILLSISYLCYASMMMFIGVVKKYFGFRIFAALIFTSIILKTFFIDIWDLDELLRIFVFIILGFVLLGVGFYYTKNTQKIKKFLFSEEE